MSKFKYLLLALCVTLTGCGPYTYTTGYSSYPAGYYYPDYPYYGNYYNSNSYYGGNSYYNSNYYDYPPPNPVGGYSYHPIITPSTPMGFRHPFIPVNPPVRPPQNTIPRYYHGPVISKKLPPQQELLKDD
jgi:hypothetical protein